MRKELLLSIKILSDFKYQKKNCLKPWEKMPQILIILTPQNGQMLL